MMNLVEETCCVCGVIFGMTKEYIQNVQQQGKSFSCPNGHSQHYRTQSYEQLKDECKFLYERHEINWRENERRAKKLRQQIRELKAQIPSEI